MPGPWDAAMAAARAVVAVADILPTIEDEVTAEVIGQPGANRSTLYFLAAAAAFGAARPTGMLPGLLPPVGLFMVEYDAADNWVRMTLRLNASALTLPGVAAGALALGVFRGPLFRGPAPAVVGGTFPLVGPAGGPFLWPVPLPATGDTVLTTDTLALDKFGLGLPLNPVPPGDGRSRGVVVRGATPGAVNPDGTWNGNLTADLLIPMVFAALTNPGSSDQTVFPTV